MHSRTTKQAKDMSLTENNVVTSSKKELAEFFNSYIVHTVKIVDGYIISVAYGVYSNLRLQRKSKKKCLNKMLLDY